MYFAARLVGFLYLAAVAGACAIVFNAFDGMGVDYNHTLSLIVIGLVAVALAGPARWLYLKMRGR